MPVQVRQDNVLIRTSNQLLELTRRSQRSGCEVVIGELRDWTRSEFGWTDNQTLDYLHRWEREGYVQLRRGKTNQKAVAILLTNKLHELVESQPEFRGDFAPLRVSDIVGGPGKFLTLTEPRRAVVTAPRTIAGNSNSRTEASLPIVVSVAQIAPPDPTSKLSGKVGLLQQLANEYRAAEELAKDLEQQLVVAREILDSLKHQQAVSLLEKLEAIEL